VGTDANRRVLGDYKNDLLFYRDYKGVNTEYELSFRKFSIGYINYKLKLILSSVKITLFKQKLF